MKKSLLLLLPLVILLLAGGVKAQPFGTVTSSSVTTYTHTLYSSYTTVLTATYYYAYGFSIIPETTIITTVNGTPTKTGITLYSTSFWGVGNYTYTVRTDVTTATAVIVFIYRSGYPVSIVTNTWYTTYRSATYTMTTVGKVHRTGNGTAATYIIATGSIVFNSTRTTIITSTTFITSLWDVTDRIVEHSISSNYFETKTIVVIIQNTYGLSYESTATVIEVMTKITSESVVLYETTYDQLVSNSNTYINYTLQTLSKETYYTTFLTIIENGTTYSLTFGDFDTLTELTDTTYNKTLRKTTITTTFTGYIDAEAGVIFDAYVDSQYYSTSTITVIYHDVQSFVTTTTPTTTVYTYYCGFRIRWLWLWYHDCSGILHIWINDWYIVLHA